ncbi:hypothetical protein [Capnocytophaga gingivalis]|uniref:Lipoprotein n=1 Tax=Capnocytophaga gingivalis TaxID=1017 RepID=A0ABU5YA80_9FLAO|nr:hypothetical protein [Capnocytophaga gingivalis]MEB3040851.1 hypothetical protein [Capnocytophaga gingivalis]
MKKIITKVAAGILGLFLALTSLSCSKEERNKLEGKTDVTVLLRDSDGTPLKEWVVYAFNEFAWGAGSTFHAKESATNAEGKAEFSGLDIKDDQEVYRFVVYYTETKKNIFGKEVSKESLKKVVPVTLKPGESQQVNLTLGVTTNSGNNGNNNNNNNNNNSGNANIVNPGQSKAGTIILINTSRNPYTVEVNGEAYVIEGKTTKRYIGALGTYTVSWKQNSGYVLYPTEGSTEVELTGGQNTKEVRFPNE